ncbi:MAG: hypothetical protein P0Y66_22180 [Candidatus Kaistia colombiensis]|nr:MAG: hypothetical protein P0Y66_22180 [Kaistia sp.]
MLSSASASTVRSEMSWARLDALAGRASDRLFGERVRIEPQAAGRVVIIGPDPDRPAFEIRATLDITEHSDHARGEGTRNGARQDVNVQEIALLIETGSIVAPDALPKAGDYVIALDRPGAPKFKIATPAGQNGGRHLFMMIPVPT